MHCLKEEFPFWHQMKIRPTEVLIHALFQLSTNVGGRQLWLSFILRRRTETKKGEKNSYLKKLVFWISMASSILGSFQIPSLHFNEANRATFSAISMNLLPTKNCPAFTRNSRISQCLTAKAKISLGEDVLVKQSNTVDKTNGIEVVSIHHVGLLCENLERSLEFYQNLLGLEINEARPNDKLPYRGAWLWVGSEMIHLMELPNPDPLTGRPEHGGRDRHACIAIRDVSKLKAIFDKAGVHYTLSKSGRPAIFARDPDANALEFTQVDA